MGPLSAGSRAMASTLPPANPFSVWKATRRLRKSKVWKQEFYVFRPMAPTMAQKVTVGTLIGYLVAPGEPAPFEATATSGTAINHVAHFREGEAPSEPVKAAARTEPRPTGVKRRISPRADAPRASLALKRMD